MKKSMTFAQAKRKLTKIAKGEYHSIKHELTETHVNDLEPRCGIYIDGENWYGGETWELAFENRTKATNKTPMPKEIINAQQPN